jgi:GNAT superfamily N-acetyltransferase
MKNFIDKVGRAITLNLNDEGHLDALHNGKVIGTFEFSSRDDFPGQNPELVHMNVEKLYQRAGIGYQLMGFAVSEYGYFILPKPLGYFAPNELTDDGAKLVTYCFRDGLLGPDFEKQYDQR